MAGDDKFLVMGGSENYLDYTEDMNGTRHVQEYDVVTGGWSSGVPLPFPLFEGCAVNTESGIVVLGDFEGGPFTAYILVDEEWHPLPPSTFYHANPACAQVTLHRENVLIALSGQNIKYFSFLQNKWIKMKPPDVKRSKNKPPTVGMSFGSIVISGGVENLEVSDKMEIWEESAGVWKTVEERKNLGRKDQTGVSMASNYLLCDF